MDQLWLAQSKLRRRRFDECIEICTEILKKNPYDKAAWFIKTRAITENDYIDDCDMEEETLGDMMVNEETMAVMPRPGTSLKKPSTGIRPMSQGIRPMSALNRPITGFSRPSTQSLNNSNSNSSRPLTMNGRLLRLGTQSMLCDSDKFINPDTLNLNKFFRDGILSKLLINFLYYSEKNIRKCLELCSMSTKYVKFKDYFYKLRLGQCYYALGMYRDAEKQFNSCLKNHGANISFIPIYLYLSKIYMKLDQPKNSINCYNAGLNKLNFNDISFILGKARVYELLNDVQTSTYLYKDVLKYESSNIEAMACLGSQYFYLEQYEISLQFYKRLLQMGIQNSELWNNIALCAYYCKQYDIVLQCFKQALNLCVDDDILLADVWYNISIVLISCGDLPFAYKALKITVTANPNHGEAWNNLAILEYKINKTYDKSIVHFDTSHSISDFLYEPLYNSALAYYNVGNCQSALQKILKSLQLFPNHYSSKKLHEKLQNEFNIL
eukprot:154351_1